MNEKRKEIPKEYQIEEEIKSENPITVYYLRHGETTEDKTDPLRGLTEKGIKQVEEAIQEIIKEIPDKKIQIRLYSSGSERTQEQCIIAAKILKEAGFTDVTIDQNSLPGKRVEFTPEGIKFTSILEREEKDIEQKKLVEELGLKVEGPGIAKRIAELRAPKEYKKKLRELEEETGIPAVIHWMMDKNLPPGTESAEEKAKIIETAIEITNRWAQHIKKRGSKPIVALVFGHASALTAYGAKAFGMDKDKESLKKFGEVKNAEGLKIIFSGIAGKGPEIEPFGKVIEEKVKKKE
jgi:broad specificity phosphatase PhoE